MSNTDRFSSPFDIKTPPAEKVGRSSIPLILSFRMIAALMKKPSSGSGIQFTGRASSRRSTPHLPSSRFTPFRSTTAATISCPRPLASTSGY